jgi:hypothetical protein
MKSRLFINRALDEEGRDFDERAFWACSALELLGKAALARVSPLLIAVPTDDGKSLLAASGLDDATGFTTVQAKTVWSRCARVFKPFNEGDAKKVSLGRNAYIHSASVGFDKFPERAWWPLFWSQAVILLHHIEEDLSSYVPSRHVRAVEAHLATNKKNLERRLEAALEHARGRLSQHAAGTLSAKAAQEWEAFALPSGFRRIEYDDCPACGEGAWIGGEDRLDVRVEYSHGDDDWGDALVTLEIGTDYLACPNCHLLLDDFDLIVEADIPTSFQVEGDPDDIEYEPAYNNE